MTETTYDRRATDKAAEVKLQMELDAQVLAENDPSKRANLMVLNAIYRALVANTATTHEVKQDLADLTNKFTEHRNAEEAFINKGKGVWSILLWLLGLAQVAVGYLIVDTRDTLRSLEASTYAAQIADQKLITRIEVLEAKP